MAIAASNFKIPLDIKTTYEVQIKHRPSIQDNIKHWQAFEDDKQIKEFLECMDEFSKVHIDEEQEKPERGQQQFYKNNMVGQKIIELKTNFIPKGLVPLERFFYNNDVFLKSEIKMDKDSTVDCNIGT